MRAKFVKFTGEKKVCKDTHTHTHTHTHTAFEHSSWKALKIVKSKCPIKWIKLGIF
jgi:hypothetical protein